MIYLKLESPNSLAYVYGRLNCITRDNARIFCMRARSIVHRTHRNALVWRPSENNANNNNTNTKKCLKNINVNTVTIRSSC